MFAGVQSTFQSLLAQPAVLAMGAGVLAGAVTGTALVVTGTLPSAPAAELMLMECPDAGREVAHVRTGVAMLVTGRNPESTWVELYIGVPGIQTGWAAVNNLKLDTSIDSLPVVNCVVAPVSTLGPPPSTGGLEPSIPPTVEPTVIATVLPTISLAPGQTPSPSPPPTRTPRPTRTPVPTITPLPPPPTIPPTAKPTVLPTADTFAPTVSAPSIASPGAFGNGSYYTGHNPCAAPSATIRVTASDPSGLTFVRLYYRSPDGVTSFGTMYPVGGNTYEYVLTPPNTWPQGEIGLWSIAQDAFGNTSAYVPFNNPYSTSDVSLFWNPVCIT